MIWIVVPLCAVGGFMAGMAIGMISCRVDRADDWMVT